MKRDLRDAVIEARNALSDVIHKPWLKKWAVVERLRYARAMEQIVLRHYALDDARKARKEVEGRASNKSVRRLRRVK